MSAISLCNPTNAANGLFPLNVVSMTLPNTASTVANADTKFNFYSNCSQASQLVPLTFAGPWAAPLSRYASLTRIGPVVFLKLADYNDTATMAAAAAAAMGSIPSEYCPLSTISVTSVGLDNASAVAVIIDIASNGSIVVSPLTSTTFTGTGSAQFGQTVLCWMVN